MIAGRTFAMGLLGVLAAACTPVEWQHKTYGVAPSQAELGDCHRSAYLEARQQAFFYDFAWPRYFGGPYYRPWLRYGYSLSPRYGYGDPFFLENDLFNYCMQIRGYQLVPARPADRSG